MRNLRILPYLILLVVLSNCVTVKQHYNAGQYHKAIKAGAVALHKKPLKTKQAIALEKAFNIEKTKLLNRIEELKLGGDPNCWVEVYALYDKIDYYQKQLQPFLPIYIEKEMRYANIELVNVAEEKADAKLKAAEYLYAKGNQLLNAGNKQAAREAFYTFKQVKTYFATYKDVENKLNQAYQNGQNHVKLALKYQANAIVPQAFVNNLKAFQPQILNSQWTKYSWAIEPNQADYTINVKILNVNIGPEQIKETEYQEVNTITDGVRYVLDIKGNVAKDSLGNDITEPNIIDVVATVQKTAQHKEGILNYMVEFKNANNQIIKQLPLAEQLVFHNEFARFIGDERALSKQSKAIIGGGPVPFPQDVEMVMNASEIVKTNSINIIKNHTYLVIN